MRPIFADLTCSPPRLKNVTLARNDSAFQGDHVILGNSEQIAIEFEVSEKELVGTIVSVVGLVSRLNPDEGHAPVSLSLNGNTFVNDYTVLGGGNIPQKCNFPAPRKLLHTGANVFALQVAADARSYFWLYHCTVDTADNIGRSEKARLTAAASSALFTYQVDQAWGDLKQWRRAGQLEFLLDCGEKALPSMLSWRDQKGNLASISFQASMGDFIGFYQRPDEGPMAYRGRLTGRRPAPELPVGEPVVQTISEPARHLVVYRTAHSWGGDNQWHKAAPLAFYLDCGEESLLVNLTWRDQKNNAGSIGFAQDLSSFYGYYQRVKEGPISYWGELVDSLALAEKSS